jgi:nitroreductase
MKNEVINALCERRSVRGYKNEQISDEQLEQILKAGTYAPSGRGRQPSIIIAVQNKEIIKALSEKNAQIMGTPDRDPFYGAPTVLIVLADKSIPTHFEDGCLVMGNLMNAAYAVGVDSCWIHRAKETFDSDFGRALLDEWGVVGDYVGIGHVALGYRSSDYPTAAERKQDYVRFVK